MLQKSFFILLFFILAACFSLNQPSVQLAEQDLLATPLEDRALFKRGLVASALPILNELEGSTIYHLDMIISEQLDHFEAMAEIFYTNMEDVPLGQIQFRLFPNILGGKMAIESVSLDGEIPKLDYQLENSLLVITLDQPLIPGESMTLNLKYRTRVADSVDLNYGVQAYFDDVLTLAHAYPMVAVYDDEGWNAEIPPQAGDVTYSDMSFFIARINAPVALQLAATGREISHVTEANRQVVTFAAGPVRDFYLAASPTYKIYSRKLGGVTLNFYTTPADASAAGQALDIAAKVLQDFERRYAPYPYSELDFVSTPTQALGIEYPGLIAITERLLSTDNNLLEYVLAHEIGHQWFYNLVGNDQLDDPWLDESLAQFVTLQYFADEYGEAGKAGFEQDLSRRWESIGGLKIPIGLPVADYTDQEYSAIVYGRGALFFSALRDALGTESFDAFMRDYTLSYAWQISTPEGMQDLAEKHCKCNLQPLFDEWVY